jgi:hypothetical protein
MRDIDLSEIEFKLLAALCTRSNHDACEEDDADNPTIPKDEVAMGDEGWTLDKDNYLSVHEIIRSLAGKGLIKDTGLRRRGHISGLYEIAWVVTELAREQYGEQIKQSLN